MLHTFNSILMQIIERSKSMQFESNDIISIHFCFRRFSNAMIYVNILDPLAIIHSTQTFTQISMHKTWIFEVMPPLPGVYKSININVISEEMNFKYYFVCALESHGKTKSHNCNYVFILSSSSYLCFFFWVIKK